MLRIYNTLTRQQEPFETLEPGKVKMYVCGPTVYGSAHIGHAMSSIVFDMIRRYLEFKGYAVDYVQNFTDVDDKIIQKANTSNESWDAVSQRYIEEFLTEMDALNIRRASHYISASEVIPQIQQMIAGLLEADHAYTLNGDVYFRVGSDDDYGKLSHRRLDEQMAGARVERDDAKEHPADFALWKGAKPGEPSWESPWGAGRPGWHIECSAMNLMHHGPQIDIHGGGADLIFPHHENEIAQSECFTGQPFARYWVHNGLMQMGSEKMSRSVGNLVRIGDLLKQVSANGYRYFILSSHYRRPLSFHDEALQAAETAAQRLTVALRAAEMGADDEATLRQRSEQALTDFEAAMDDDFNTPLALAALTALAKDINTARSAGKTGATFQQAQETLRRLMQVLGLTTEAQAQQLADAAPFIALLVALRRELRGAKQFALADAVRDRLKALNIVLEDGVNGTTWRYEEHGGA